MAFEIKHKFFDEKGSNIDSFFGALTNLVNTLNLILRIAMFLAPVCMAAYFILQFLKG
jgi:hypothetical protein